MEKVCCEDVFSGFPREILFGNYRFGVKLCEDAEMAHNANGLFCIGERLIKIKKSIKCAEYAKEVLMHEISHALYRISGDCEFVDGKWVGLVYNEEATECLANELIGSFTVVGADEGFECFVPDKIRMGHFEWEVVEEFENWSGKGDIDYCGFRIRVGKRGSVYDEYERLYNLMYAWVVYILDRIGLAQKNDDEVFVRGMVNHMMTCLRFVGV